MSHPSKIRAYVVGRTGGLPHMLSGYIRKEAKIRRVYTFCSYARINCKSSRSRFDRLATIPLSRRRRRRRRRLMHCHKILMNSVRVAAN